MAKNNASANQSPPGGFNIRKVRRASAVNTANPTSDRNRVRLRLSKKALAAGTVDNKAADLTVSALQTAKVARIGWVIFFISLVYWPVRLYSSIGYALSVVAVVTTSDSWLGWFDVFGLLEYGAVGAFAITLGINYALSAITFLMAVITYMVSGVNPWKSNFSTIVIAFMFGINAIPILNLLEGVWGWLLFVVITRAKETIDKV